MSWVQSTESYLAITRSGVTNKREETKAVQENWSKSARGNSDHFRLKENTLKANISRVWCTRKETVDIDIVIKSRKIVAETLSM